MNLDEFDQRVKIWCDRVYQLLEQTQESSDLQKTLVPETLIELSSALEELEVAQEELRQQNETLCQQNQALEIARQTAEAESQRAAAECQRYQELFEFAPDGYLVSDPKGMIQEANRAAASLLNVSPQFLVGKSLVTFIPESEQQSFQTQLTKPRSGDWVREWESRLQLSDGRLIDIALTVAAVRDQRGQQTGLRWLLRDITERKQSEQAMQRWANIFQHAQWGVAVDSSDGETLQIINPAFAQMHGYSLEEMVGLPIINLFAPQSREDAAEYIRLVDEQGHITIESEHIRKDGSVFPVLVDVTSVKDEEGKLLYRGVNLQDISERKQLLDREQAAREEAEVERKRATFLAEASRLLATSLNYRTTLINLAQLTIPTLGDWCFIDIIENNQPLFSNPVVAAIDSEKQRLVLELRRRYPPAAEADYGAPKVFQTGTPILINEISDSFLLSMARDAEHLSLLRQLNAQAYMIVPLTLQGRKLGTLALASAQLGRHYSTADLAMVEELARRAAIAIENARLYQEAQEANRIKDEFLAIVSHELRTPLNAMLGWVQMLRSRKLNSAMTSKALETIERNAKLQGKLIDDILDVSRIVQGKIRLNISPVNLVSVIDTVIENVRPTADLKRIQIERVLNSPVGLVLGDAERLQQVVWNLLSNAIKFTPHGGRVIVELEQIKLVAQLRVKDKGKGISPDFLPYVFERFRQADGSITRAHGGLGLGLAIVRHLVEMHNGAVNAFSEGEGQGATFTVQLPVINASQSQFTPEKDTPFVKLPVLDGIQVLVVDDNADTCELVKLILEKSGARVRAVLSAGEALAAIVQSKPDVLISDISMPNEDGYSLIRKVRRLELEQGWQLPAIALTALAREEERKDALSSGFQLHLPKPVEPAEIITGVAKLAGYS